MTVSEWIETVLYMIASIGALLIGFELLSGNVTKLARKGLKKLFNKTSKNALAGVGIGTAATMIMQSSGATTIMVVGFVNAGIMTLYQATAMIMGCNIGTTITAQLAALAGTGNGFNFGAYALGFAGIGMFIVMFSKKEKIKTIGYALAGFGLLFFGLETMSNTMKVDAVKQAIEGVLVNVGGNFAPLIFFLLGIVITALVQSSSLVTSIIISIAAAGIYIGAGEGATSLTNNVLFLILGTNIGSCVTAVLSSLGAGTNAKRAAFIHLMFNTLGSVIFGIFLLIYKNFMVDTFARWFTYPQTQLAMFHTFFNIACTIIFLPFINVFVKLSQFFIKDSKEKHTSTFKYIDDRMVKSPTIAIHQIRQEMADMYLDAKNILINSLDNFLEMDDTHHEEVIKENERLDDLSKDIITYLVDLAKEDIAYEDECTISAFQRTLDDILRIGDIGDNICKYTRRAVRDNMNLSDVARSELLEMKNKITNLYESTSTIFLTKNLITKNMVDETEESIDALRKKMIDDHFDRLSNGTCSANTSGVYVNLVNNLERSADHMTYIVTNLEESLKQAKNA